MWYAIQTEPGYEEAVRQEVESMIPEKSRGDCRILYCIRKKRYQGSWHDKRERFLPGYMFLVTENRETEEKQISEFCPVKQEEEEFLMKLTQGKNEIGMSYGVIRDGVLEIRSGVLVGMESRVRKIDRHKRKGYIAMRINDEEKLAEIGLEITEKTCAPSVEDSVDSRDRTKREPIGGEGTACGM